MKEKKNNLISQEYIQAGLFFPMGKQLIKFYKAISLSQNNFYSVLALNTITCKNMISKDENIIFEYIDYLENLNLSKSQKDLVEFKKALFLIELINFEEGKKLIEKIASVLNIILKIWQKKFYQIIFFK